MNEIIEKMLTRHVIRRFQDKQLDEETLQQILTAGLYAPSAGNNQRSRIVVCQDREINERLETFCSVTVKGPRRMINREKRDVFCASKIEVNYE
jgi:nitroreductase